MENYRFLESNRKRRVTSTGKTNANGSQNETGKMEVDDKGRVARSDTADMYGPAGIVKSNAEYRLHDYKQ